LSQAGINGNGSIAAIFTITTDNGTATPSGGNVNLYADTTVDSGTVNFSAVGNTIHLNFQDSNANIGIGEFAVGAALTTGVSNVCLGAAAGRRIASSDANIAIGSTSLNDLASGAGGNIAIGSTALVDLVNGTRNISIGSSSSSAFTTNESNNIVIGWNNNGTILDNNTLRIGRATGAGNGELNRAFIQGIVGVTTTNTEGVTINTSTGQLGSRSLTVLPNYSVVNATPYVVGATVYYMTVDTSTFAITIQLPDAPTQYRTFVIKDSAGNAAALNITVTTVSGVLNIDAAPTFIMNSNYQSIQLVYSGFGYEVY